MTISKELLTTFKEKYEKSEKLIAEESKSDPPAEPFRSHYAARDILTEIAQNAKNLLETLATELDADNGADIQRLKYILAHITVDLGKIANFTEEVTSAERQLNQSIDLISGHELDDSSICAYLSALNEIGVIWMNRGETDKSMECLIKAQNAYETFVAQQAQPYTLHDILSTNEVGTGGRLLEKCNIFTLFYLAQVYGSLTDVQKSAFYCHSTLLKQLKLDDFEPIDWALNAATLSQFFCTNNRYTEVIYRILGCMFGLGGVFSFISSHLCESI